MSHEIFTQPLHTPIQNVQFTTPNGEVFSCLIKRDDLINKEISGNKWRKLKFNFQELINSKHLGIASFGGAFSNHIAALAALGNKTNVPTIGFIRTHQVDFQNPTLALAQALGMKLIPLSREEYKLRCDPNFLQSLKKQHPEYMFVPEGGSNDLAKKGLDELAKEIEQQSQVDTIACAIGSGGTISGLLDALPNKRFIGVAVVNDHALLTKLQSKYGSRLTIDTSTIFGGYGKTSQELNEFCLSFFQQTQVPIEPIYTGKLFYYLCNTPKMKYLNDNILAVHTGGLQGIKGLEYRRQSPPLFWQPILQQLDS